MNWQALFEGSLALMPTLLTVIAVVALMVLSRFILFRNKRSFAQQEAMGRQLILIALGVAGFAAVTLSLPIAPEDRRQLLSLAGLLLSGAVALASTSFLGNIMAGLMLRAVKNIGTGDYIFVEEIEGRVSERGLFRVEIQNESRDLVSVPNMFLASHPVRVVQTTGTIIHADVSLGYDVPRQQIQDLLESAANDSQLSDAFVQIRSLDNHSVIYRVSGVLQDVTRRLSVKSKLNGQVLDRLHEAGIEIASPTIMSQRPLAEERKIIPANPKPRHIQQPDEEEDTDRADRLAFDKAHAAALSEKLDQLERGLNEYLEELKQTGQNQLEIERVERALVEVSANRTESEEPEK